MSNAIAHRHSPVPERLSLVADVVDAATSGYAWLVASLSAVMRPRQESPAEAASRLRTLAQQYEAQQPSFAADLRAAADATWRC